MTGHAIPDIPRLYTAIAECLACMMVVVLLKPKISKIKLGFISLAYFIILVAFMEFTANVILWLWIPCMITAFLLMSAYIYVCTGLNYYKSVYFAVFTFSAAEFIASLEWQTVNYVRTLTGNTSWVSKSVILVVVYSALIFLFYKIFKSKMSVMSKIDIRRADWLTSILIAVIVFGISNLRFITDKIFVPGQYSLEIANARTLIDLAGISFLYAHCVSCCHNEVIRELNAVAQTLQSQYQQYKQSRESIDLINMKYHDFKHQIQYLRSEQDPKKRNEFLDRLESDIKSFEVQNKTGNAVLDTILTGKSLYCYKHSITMTSVADGKLLDFMNVVDICSIFGNALDNAIESVMRIEDKEKRLIHVTVSQVNNFVMIRIENYYEGVIITDGDEFLSTKDDKKFHGYGIKSIKYTADKYDGAVYINTDDNWFDIKIAIPKNS